MTEDKLSHEVIAAIIAVHKELGPGLLESIYEKCLLHELTLRGYNVKQQASVSINYRGLKLQEILRCDLIVNDDLLLELKSVEAILPIHKAQAITYLKLLGLRNGLLVNFNSTRVSSDIHRVFNNM